MSEEKKYFICRNEECTSSKASDGNMVFQYETSEDSNHFRCNKCNSQYYVVDDKILYYAAIEKDEITFNGEMLFRKTIVIEETVIESIEDYENFAKQFEISQIYFPRLVFRNIKKSNYSRSKLFY